MAANNLNSLLAHSRELKHSFDQLSFDRLEEDTAEGSALLCQIHDWLKACVDFGRLLPDPSPDRRALQGRVDYWTSLLSQRGRPLPDIDRVAAFDPEAGSPLEVDFPYPGLAPYSEGQRGLFCGREHEAGEYATQLERNRALLLVSESGGGKSSLAISGILPRLREAHPDWIFAPRMTPGAYPLDALQNALRAALPGIPADALQFSGASAESQDVARAAAQPVLKAFGGRMLVLFIDQLEELLTLCNDAQQQAIFSAVLGGLAAGKNCCVLATIRSDHQHQLANSQACRPLFSLLAANDGVKTLAPLGFDDIRRAIRKPAESVGLRFVPPEIIDKLAQETANLVGGLPLLQFALWRLWESRPRRLDFINESQVARLPNVVAALGTAAEEQYEALTPRMREVCQRLMLELTIPAENYEEPMRRRRRQSALTNLLERYLHVNAREVEALIQRFVDARLLVRTGEGKDAQLEVAHEAIFRNWKTFREWVSSPETKGRLQAIRLIGKEASAWVTKDRAPDYLKLRGEPLERALVYERDGWLAEAESSEYVKACSARDAAERRKEEEARQERRRAEQAEAHARWLAHIATVASVAAILGVIAAWGWYSARQQDRHSRARQRAAEALEARDRDPQLALLRAVQGVDIEGAQETRSALLHVLQRHPFVPPSVRFPRSPVQGLRFTEDNAFLIAGGADGRCMRWDLSDLDAPPRDCDAAHVGTTPGGQSAPKASAPDTATEAVGRSDGTIVLRDEKTGKEIGEPLLGHDDSVTALAFSHKGATLASGDEHGTILLWPVGIEAWKARACDMAGRPLEDGEVDGFLEKYHAEYATNCGLRAKRPETLATAGTSPTTQLAVPEDVVEVPGGWFWMGCNEKDDKDCMVGETSRRVFVDDFAIERTEVTVAQYGACVAAGVCDPSRGNGQCNSGKAGRDDHPMNCVDWLQAKQYCEWRERRLPREAEWEKAARGPRGSKYPWGNDEFDANSKQWANIADEDARKLGVCDVVKDYHDGFPDSAPVRSFPDGASKPNKALGMAGNVYDMAGNVYEWVWDKMAGGRALRGGSWKHMPYLARASYRRKLAQDSHFDDVGFRCAMSRR